jgi:CRP-like cAMP-binding protein
MPEFISTIENIVLFKDLTETEMRQVAERVTIRNYPLGEYLFIAGTPRSKLYIINTDGG